MATEKIPLGNVVGPTGPMGPPGPSGGPLPTNAKEGQISVSHAGGWVGEYPNRQVYYASGGNTGWVKIAELNTNRNESTNVTMLLSSSNVAGLNQHYQGWLNAVFKIDNYGSPIPVLELTHIVDNNLSQKWTADNFVLAHNYPANPWTVEVWMRFDITYITMLVSVLSYGNISGISNRPRWELPGTIEGSTSSSLQPTPTPGYTIVPAILVSNGYDNAGSHNAIYRGRLLGNAVTDAQYSAIAAGTFNDMYIGDYWTINGVNWRIAAFDYYYLVGDVNFTKHHAVIVPDTMLGTGQMNSTSTTEGGYAGSLMRASGLDAAKTTINAAFAGNVLSYREYLNNAVLNGRPSGGAWFDCTVELMNENMVYGSGIFRPMSDGVNIPHNNRISKSQLPLFTSRPDLICTRTTHWLRDEVSGANFAGIGSFGQADTNSASVSRNIRPYFLIG